MSDLNFLFHSTTKESIRKRALQGDNSSEDRQGHSHCSFALLHAKDQRSGGFFCHVAAHARTCIYIYRYGMIWYGVVWHGMAWHGMAWHGMAWHGMALYGMVLYGMVWYGMACTELYCTVLQCNLMQ